MHPSSLTYLSHFLPAAGQMIEFAASPGDLAPVGSVTLTARHGPVTTCHVTVTPRRDGGQLVARNLLVGEDDAVTMATVGGE